MKPILIFLFLILSNSLYGQYDLAGTWKEKGGKQNSNTITFKEDSTITWIKLFRAVGVTSGLPDGKSIKHYDSTFNKTFIGKYYQTKDSLYTMFEGYSRRGYHLKIKSNKIYLSYWMKVGVPKKENIFVTLVYVRIKEE